MKKILLITPPFTQLNTPYPAVSYLIAALKQEQIPAVQFDLSIALFLKVFSKHGLTSVFDYALEEVLEKQMHIPDKKTYRNINTILAQRAQYIDTIDTVVSFLQGNRQSMAQLLVSNHFLPRAARFKTLIAEHTDYAFGEMGIRDKAIYYCTLYLEDIGDLISTVIDANFGFSRYAEQLGRCASSFDAIHAYLQQPLTLIEEMMLSIFAQQLALHKPDVVGMSVPFPGNLIASLRCAQYIKNNYPSIHVAMGGGFPNTELRSVSDPRLFNYIDYLLLDDGEASVCNLMRYISDNTDSASLIRTFICDEHGNVKYINSAEHGDWDHHRSGYPDYEGINFSQYISICDMLNPMHRLWSDGKWIKLTLAHGCYWGKCSFCDGTLDYIKRYSQTTAATIVDRIVQLIEQTGEYGFHFVDEAAPPALLKAMAQELIDRKVKITWWGNIRFEKSFTAELCQLLSQSGCIAVSGGVEVASNRLLKLINKGVTVEQVAHVANHFTQAGIMVHAYLMYGFPTQTVQETIDALEIVRQLFQAGIIHSAFWHRFALTAHSPIGQNPPMYNIRVTQPPFGGFANNDVEFEDLTNIDHSQFSEGLKVSLFNYMQGIGFDKPLSFWFPFKIPRTKISSNYIQTVMRS
ncbi:MAG: B12-binding domain-containing radical SAM protein [Marinifilaceae bacterium]